MSTMNDHHHKAMDLAARGIYERTRGNHAVATRFFADALDFELKALKEIKEPVQPTHSVLHRSAATLALDCENTRLAQQLTTKALAENPPHDIAEELRQVLQKALNQNHTQTIRQPQNALADDPQPFDYQAE